jgi:hypothetical protein
MDASQWDAVAAVLRTADFPANRQDLLNHARLSRPDEQVLAWLEELPVGVYRNLVDVRDRVRNTSTPRRDEPA